MKAAKLFTGLLVVLGLCLTAFSSHGQDLAKRITIMLKNVTLDEAIRQMGTQGGVYFSYSSQAIPVNNKVTVKARNKPVRVILDDVLKKNGIEWIVIENQIILKPARQKPETSKLEKTAPPPDIVKHTISGYLKDKITGEVLIGAYAYAKGTTLGTTSNAYGFYSLTLPEGNYTLVFSFVGYKTVEQYIDLKTSQTNSYDLETAKTEIKTVEIVADEKEQPIKSGQLSIFKLQPKLLGQLPGIGGDIDIIESLQAIPGIKSFGDGSSMFYVRGGESDQNLILVDEAPIYNPAHLFGFVSALAPESIKDITIYKGDAPASYGGRLSSFIDIKTKDGNMKRFGIAGNLGVLLSDLSLEGPFKKDRASWLVTGRISNLNWLLSNRKTNREIKLYFYDFNVKLNFNMNRNNRLFLTLYYGQDVFARANTTTNRTFGINWNNLLGCIRWNHIYNDRLFSNTTVYYSRYNYVMDIYKEGGDYWKSSISNLSVKSDYTWYLNPANTLKGGFEIGPYRSNPGNVYFSDEEIQSKLPYIQEYRSSVYAVYLSNDQDITTKINIKYGVRLPLWQNYGPGTFYSFDQNYLLNDTLTPDANRAYVSYFRPEPRLIMTISPAPKTALRLSYSRTAQFIQLLNNSASPFTSLESWVPCGPNIKPQTADLYAFGYSRDLFRSAFTFTAETYFKQFHHAFDYTDHSNILFNPLLEGELRYGKSWSYGVEIMLRKERGKFTGWAAYTYSRAFRQIIGINNNEKYPAGYDTPNDVSLNLSFDSRRRWSFILNWVYHTGSAISTPTMFYYYNGISVPYYGKKNNDRLPDYHRLDLSVVCQLNKPERKYQHSLSLNIYNVYGRKNPFSLNFNKFMGDKGNFLVPYDNAASYELVPTTISAAGIIPSVNYKFRF